MKTTLFYTSLSGHTKYFAEKVAEDKFPNTEVTIYNLDDMITGSIQVSNIGTWYNDSDKFLDIVSESDNIILAAPLWNLQAAPAAKSLLDKLAVINKTFKYGPEGLILIREEEFSKKKMYIVGTSGAAKEDIEKSGQSAFEVLAAGFKMYVGLQPEVLWYGGINRSNVKGLSIEEKWDKLK